MPHHLSGNPAIVGREPCRPEILRRRFSAGLPLQKTCAGCRRRTALGAPSTRGACATSVTVSTPLVGLLQPYVGAKGERSLPLYSRAYAHSCLRLARVRFHHGVSGPVPEAHPPRPDPHP